jgi:hypothetical protein
MGLLGILAQVAPARSPLLEGTEPGRGIHTQPGRAWPGLVITDMTCVDLGREVGDLAGRRHVPEERADRFGTLELGVGAAKQLEPALARVDSRCAAQLDEAHCLAQVACASQFADTAKR